MGISLLPGIRSRRISWGNPWTGRDKQLPHRSDGWAEVELGSFTGSAGEFDGSDKQELEIGSHRGRNLKFKPQHLEEEIENCF